MATNLALANDAAQLNSQKAAASLQVFSTCPSSVTAPDDYVRKIGDVARWSEAAGCSGILVYTDNSLVDPWLVSQIIIVMLGSAVCGQISTPELSYAANLIQSRNFRAFESFIVATLIYLALAMLLRRLLNWAGPRFVFGK